MDNNTFPNKVCRCSWLDTSKTDYVNYHDEEWGVPVYDDQTLFEYLCLESAQAGLSWYTILKRRDGYRNAFNNFNIDIVAKYDQNKVEELVRNTDIIRHRGKITAVINNAQRFIDIKKEFVSFSVYLWQFVNNKTIINSWSDPSGCPTSTNESDALCKDLRKRGFKFVGPTICYAYMQACGVVNDHDISCYKRSQIINKYQQS